MKISELIAALQEHQAEYGDTEVEFRGEYGSSNIEGAELDPAPEKIHGPWKDHDAWARWVREWQQRGRPALVWTGLSNG